MKPKLWDGANAVGEAKERALQTVDAPYLSASGPGFLTSKKGQFSEVTGSTEEAPHVEVTNWWSTTDNAESSVLIVGSQSYKRSFRFRGIKSQGSGGANAGSGTVLRADGRGAGRIMGVSSYEGEYGDGTLFPQTHRNVIFDDGKTTNGGRSTRLLYTIPTFGVSIDGIINPGGFQIASLTYFFVDQDGQYAVTAVTVEQSAGGWPRARPAALIAAASPGGGWATATVLLPVDGGDPPADTAAPDFGIHGLTRLSTVYADNVLRPPKLRVSNDLGQTWSSGVDITPFWGGMDFWKNEDGIDLHPMPPNGESEVQSHLPFSPNGVPRNEEWWMDPTNDYPNPDDTRRAYYGCLPNHAYFTTGGTCIQLEAISNRLVLVANARAYSDPALNNPPPISTLAVFDVTSGMVNRTAFTGWYPVRLVMLGRGAWGYHIQNDTESRVKLTVDFGQTYTDMMIPAGFRTLFPILPYSPEPNAKYLIGATIDYNGAIYVCTTPDIFDGQPWSLGGKVGVGGYNDFTAVINIGTRANPGPIDPCYPWTRDYRYEVPAWWNE